MISSFVLSSIAMVLMILSALGLAQSESLLSHWGWATATFEGSNEEVELHVGISAFLVELTANSPSGSASTTNSVHSWSNTSCTFFQNPNGVNVCQKCKDAMPGTAFFIIFSIITQFVQIMINLQRSTPYGDINCQKLMGFVTSTFGFVSGLSSLSTFAASVSLDP